MNVRNKLTLSALMSVCFLLGWATLSMAATSVSWISPADNSVYAVGDTVRLQGNASATDTTGNGLDLALVIDVSGSMGGAGIATARDAANSLVNNLPTGTTSVSVIAFNSSANTVQVLTALNSDITAVHTAINSLSTGGGTRIESGIHAATAELTSTRHTASRTQMMVVLSDGYNNYGNSAPLAAATVAHDAGITVHSVGVPGHDATLMQGIASNGGGVYTNVSDLSSLEGIFNGTGGNLVGIDHVTVNGTEIALDDGLGNFHYDFTIGAGNNVVTAVAYGTDQSSSSVTLNLTGSNSNPVPEPATMLLFGTGLAGLVVFRKKIARK